MRSYIQCTHTPHCGYIMLSYIQCTRTQHCGYMFIMLLFILFAFSGHSSSVQWSKRDGTYKVRGHLDLLSDDCTIQFDTYGYFYVHSVVTYTFEGTKKDNPHGQELRVISNKDGHPKIQASAVKETTAAGTEIFTSTISNIFSFGVGDRMRIKVGIGRLEHERIKLLTGRTQLVVYLMSL